MIRVKKIWQKAFPLPLTKRVYFSIIFLLLLYTIGMTGIIHLGFIKKERYERSQTLRDLTYNMGNHIALTYGDINTTITPRDYEEELKKNITSYLAELAKKNPGVTVAFYYKETGQLINHEEEMKLNIQIIDHIYPVNYFSLRYYVPNQDIIEIIEEKLSKEGYNFNQAHQSFSWKGDPSMYVMQPVYYDDQLIGYSWAGINKNRFHGIVNLRTAEVAFIQMFIAAISILLAWHIFRRLKSEIESFSLAATTQSDEVLLLQQNLPELRPLLEKMSAHSDEIKTANRQLAQEVIERIKAEKELARFFALSLDILCIIDFNQQVKRWNDAFAKTVLLNYKDISEKPLQSFIHPEDIQSFLDVFEQIKRGSAISNQEMRISSSINNYRWINWNAVPVLEEGLIYIAGRDITEQKETLRKLHLSEALFSKVFHANPNPMAINEIDNCKFTEVNDSFLEVTGFTREEVLWKSPEEINLWNKDDVNLQIIHNAPSLARNIEKNIYIKSGELRNWLLSIEIIELNGKLCYVTAANDITELKKFEKEIAELDRLNLVAQMAAGIGHEIRNPMMIVRGYLQVLSHKEEQSINKEKFNIMIDELDRANEIITEFLSLAKHRAENRKEHNLNQILQYLYPLIRANATLAQKDIVMDLQEIPELLLDEKEIRQLILNITRNGLEAMDNGGTLQIFTYSEKDQIILAVQDEGKGIEEDHTKKIGTPFFTTKDQGTGLGLAVCQSIVKRHNAVMSFESNEKGTTFYIAFPTKKRTEVTES
ncbi:PAS domain S-box protein [Heliorestis acidaminivorans]|uniref:histidine kinase n=1 Tax=Heliorestis acidaminivorans TaxID=553427 RepID=A0A6I0F6A0_9FIRM|nr:PAS domain-containing sensor histidine kinase [Heliorestis acidaminivorans]KAB2954357.1 PAS domain S-box protein [Heliorestis acidaminivorans]